MVTLVSSSGTREDASLIVAVFPSSATVYEDTTLPATVISAATRSPSFVPVTVNVVPFVAVTPVTVSTCGSAAFTATLVFILFLYRKMSKTNCRSAGNMV